MYQFIFITGIYVLYIADGINNTSAENLLLVNQESSSKEVQFTTNSVQCPHIDSNFLICEQMLNDSQCAQRLSYMTFLCLCFLS